MRRRRQQRPVAAESRKYPSGKIGGRAPVAQWIEQSPPKGQVARSIRVRGAISYQGRRDYIRPLSLSEVPLRHSLLTVTGVARYWRHRLHAELYTQGLRLSVDDQS